MAYSELIKNFEKVRAYMRDFYVYGFKSRNEYNRKSLRSYDDERRRIGSWLGDYMKFSQGADGKNVFLSVDSRTIKSNPFYKAWKTKSFTDGDITLHFILFDILHTPEITKTLTELTEEIDAKLSVFEAPLTFDESTVRKKLKEYQAMGLIRIQKEGRRVTYSRECTPDIADLSDVTAFFSEAAPCGVIGSYLQERAQTKNNIFTFKHHYISGAVDSDVVACLFDAITSKRQITVHNLSRHSKQASDITLVPLKIYISAQNGRQYLIGRPGTSDLFNSYRIDYLSDVRLGEVCPDFDILRQKLKETENHTWGVTLCGKGKRTERVEFDIRISDGEEYIIHRLEREKRCGKVEKLDEHNYRFTAYVYDTNEMVPWLRTYICRITRMNFSNRTVENVFKRDVEQMYRMYGIGGDGQ